MPDSAAFTSEMMIVHLQPLPGLLHHGRIHVVAGND
jgi:hypothetical protein